MRGFLKNVICKTGLFFSCFFVALLLLQGGIHLAAMAVASAVGELLHAQLRGPPLYHLNLHHAAPPLAHQLRGGLVDINGTGVYQGAAVVIHYINVGEVPMALRGP